MVVVEFYIKRGLFTHHIYRKLSPTLLYRSLLFLTPNFTTLRTSYSDNTAPHSEARPKRSGKPQLSTLRNLSISIRRHKSVTSGRNSRTTVAVATILQTHLHLQFDPFPSRNKSPPRWLADTFNDMDRHATPPAPAAAARNQNAHNNNNNKKPSYFTSALRWLRLKNYQYEVSSSLYMLTPTEKIIFSKLLYDFFSFDFGLCLV